MATFVVITIGRDVAPGTLRVEAGDAAESPTVRRAGPPPTHTPVS